MMRFILPAPPSVNAMYRTHQGRILKSKKYRAWIKDAESKLRVDMIQKYPPSGKQRIDFDKAEVVVQIDYWPKDRRHRDIDNLLKPILDLMEGHVFADDKQVAHVSVTKRQVRPAEHATVDVFVSAR